VAIVLADAIHAVGVGLTVQTSLLVSTVYSRSPKNPALQQLQKSAKSASTTPQRAIWNYFATVGVRGFWANGCRHSMSPMHCFLLMGEWCGDPFMALQADAYFFVRGEAMSLFSQTETGKDLASEALRA